MVPPSNHVTGVQKSRFYSHQQSLPHLPVPPLKQTAIKYLQTIKPLVSEKEFENTKGLVETFCIPNGYGEHLQSKLLEYANTKENWLSQWWLEHTYLQARSSVVMYYSPSVSFPKYDFSGTSGQIKHAAKLIAAILKYKIKIDDESLPVDHMGKNPLCMDQYYRILSSCRIPGLTVDDVHCHARSWRRSHHITVIHNNRFFELDVYSRDGTPLTISQLETQLSKIVVASTSRAAHAIGILTSQNRDTWGRIYHNLIQDKNNLASLKSIQRSIFALCLESDFPSVADSQWKSDLMTRLLHGGGSQWSTGNRWFDKTLQMVVDKNGGVGLLYEHCTAEGPPIAALMDHVHEFCKHPDPQAESSVLALPPAKELQFHVPETIVHDIAIASKEIDDLIGNLTLLAIDFTDYGKDFVKSMHLSPDSFIQTALQLAYYRIHKTPPATYESASLRQFRLGRTDTIRSCTVESHAFTVAMEEYKLSFKELAKMLRDAVNAHKKYANDAISGQAIDRHLLGLRLIAKNTGQEEPDIFADKTYKRAMSFNLSTSQVPCKADLCMGFGPAVNDGYGICYNPKIDKILFSVSVWNTLQTYNVETYCHELCKALRDMRKVLLSASSKL